MTANGFALCYGWPFKNKTVAAFGLCIILLQGCSEQPKTIAQAICANNASGLQQLLNSNHDPNELIRDPNFVGPPLVLAVDDPGCGRPINSVEIVSILLASGANIDAATPGGRTALMAAVGSNNTDAVKLLVQHNAFVNAQDADGRTAIMSVSSNSSVSVVKYLITNGADINQKTKDGITALSAARAVNNRAVAEYLLSLHQPL